MKRPYDLVALIEQESRVNLLESLKDEMSEQKLDAVEQRHNDIDKVNGITEEGMTVEKQFFRNDPDCKAAGKSLVEFDKEDFYKCKESTHSVKVQIYRKLLFVVYFKSIIAITQRLH